MIRIAVLAAAAALLVPAASGLAARPKAKPLADLVVRKVTTPANAVGGSTVTFRDTVANIGKASARSSTTTFYLSFDRKLDDNDIMLKETRAVPRIKRGRTSVGATKVVMPTYLTGLFEVLACSDSAKKVKESNEANNCRPARFGITISLPPQA